MRSEQQKFQYVKGEMIILSRGEYSYYQIDDLVRVLVDFNAQQALQVWGELHANVVDLVLSDDQPAEKTYYQKVDDVAFVEWLVSQGYVERMPFRELNTGSDGGPVCFED